MEQNERMLELNERMLLNQNNLVNSKERIAADYKESVNELLGEFEAKQNDDDQKNQEQSQNAIDRFKSMLIEKDQKLQEEIARNKVDIEGLQQETSTMKMEMTAIKKSVDAINVSLSELKRRVKSVEQLQAERDAVWLSINNKVEGLMDVTPDTMALQKRIVEICTDQSTKTMYQSLSQSLSMKFFDAKIVLSGYVEHQLQIPTAGKKAKAARFGMNVLKKLTEDIPLVGSVISLAEMSAKAAYDIFVLKAMAQCVIDFETMVGDAAWFSSQLALEMTEMNIGRISVIKNKYEKQRGLSADKKKKAVCAMLQMLTYLVSCSQFY